MISKESRQSAERQAENIVSQMKLDEMVSQLMHSSPAIPRLGIPRYNWWNEGLHGAARSGTATVFPQAIAMASTFSEALIHRMGEIVADEQRAKYSAFSSLGDRGIYKGLTVWSPNVNIFRDPRWGRGHETYGEDPYLSSRLGVAFIEGLQGNDESRLKTAACVKHFIAHSGPEPERHHFNSIVSEKDMEETYLPAFKAAVTEAGVDGVMGAYSKVNGVPCCASEMIESLLRAKWGFKGIFISDCWAIRDFHEQHHWTDTPEESASIALKRGCDLNCGCTYSYLNKAFSKGLITAEDIKKAAVRVFTTRVLLGLFDENERKIPFEVVASPEHRAVSLEASRKSLVLLKNSEDFLPLPKTISVAVVGPNADSRIALWGNYHGTSMCYTTVLEGVRSILGGDDNIRYSQGSSLVDDRVERLGEPGDRISEAISATLASDVCILCLGLDETVEGEMHDDGNGGIAGDRKDLRLPETQRNLLKNVASTGKPIVLVLFSGGGIDPEIEGYKNVKAVIQAWYPGEYGGRAIAEAIFGSINPSGKLPITFYRADSILPDYSSYSMKGRTYRYIEEAPLYPFGYGLSYTKYNYSDAVFDKTSLSVSFALENIGFRNGEEISFVWCHTDAPDAPSHPRLCGFARTAVKAGEKCRVTIAIDKNFNTLVNNDGKRYLHNGIWRIAIAGSQADPFSLELTGGNALFMEVKI